MASNASLEQKDAVLHYIKMRLKREETRRALAKAQAADNDAEIASDDAWRTVKKLGSPPGVYAFKDMGRTCVHVREDQDYPPLTLIVE